MSKHLGKKVGGEGRLERRRAADLRIEEGVENGSGDLVLRTPGEEGGGGWEVRKGDGGLPRDTGRRGDARSQAVKKKLNQHRKKILVDRSVRELSNQVSRKQ